MCSDPGVEVLALFARGNLDCFNELFIWRLAAGFTAISLCFSDSVHLDVESPLSGKFLGALDGQQLSVVEGSGCTINPQ